MRRIPNSTAILMLPLLGFMTCGCDVIQQMNKTEEKPPEVVLSRSNDDDEDAPESSVPEPQTPPVVDPVEPPEMIDPSMPQIYVTAGSAKYVQTPKGLVLHIVGAIGYNAGTPVPKNAQFGMEMIDRSGEKVQFDVVIDRERGVGRFDYFIPNFSKEYFPISLRAWGRSNEDEEFAPVGPEWKILTNES